MEELVLNLKKREELGKNKVDKLRADQEVPGVIYSKGKEAISLTASEKDLKKIYREYGTSNLVSVDIDGDKQKALFKEIQMHPFKNQIMHFDLYLIDMTEKITVTVPVVLLNRDDVKAQPSVLLQILDEIEVECLPADLPSEATVNVQDMQIGDSLTVADLDIEGDDKIEILTDTEEVIASLQEPREEEIDEEVEDTADAADVPTVSETEEPEEEGSEE